MFWKTRKKWETAKIELFRTSSTVTHAHVSQKEKKKYLKNPSGAHFRPFFPPKKKGEYFMWRGSLEPEEKKGFFFFRRRRRPAISPEKKGERKKIGISNFDPLSPPRSCRKFSLLRARVKMCGKKGNRSKGEKSERINFTLENRAWRNGKFFSFLQNIVYLGNAKQCRLS